MAMREELARVEKHVTRENGSKYRVQFALTSEGKILRRYGVSTWTVWKYAREGTTKEQFVEAFGKQGFQKVS